MGVLKMKFKKLLSVGLTVCVVSLGLIGCTSTKDENVLKVGASPVPHAEILEIVKDDLEKEGIKLEVIEFTDYVTPNTALNDGEIDANFFQHVPYMESFERENKMDFSSVGSVHVEPLALYSNSAKSIEKLKDNAVIAVPNDPTNGGRALLLLQNKGLIKLKADAGLEATEKDIVENKNNFTFKPMEAAQLPRVLGDVDAAIINSNYALEADLNPTTDSLLIEGTESPYANVVSVNAGKENDEKIKALINALQSDEVKKFIEDKYEGGVVPAFAK
jgi:D-methionine transport system substrate-binding protein